MRSVLLRAAAAAALGVAALTAAPAASAAELLTNGSFEDLGAAVPEGWGGYTYYFDGSVDLPGWNVDVGSVDVTLNTSGWSPAADGVASLDINGWEAGQISQSFNTTLGALYNVSFSYTRNAAGAPDPAIATVQVDGVGVHVIAPNDGTFGGVNSFVWKTGGFSFIGTGGTQTIVLAAVTGGNGGVFFDDVSVSGAVPEPATWALMIGGFGLAGAALRRRRVAVA